jgi:hypothetical protein
MTRDWELEVYCTECGSQLEIESQTTGKHYTVDLRIKPCPICLEDRETIARDKAYDEGYDKGEDDDKCDGLREAYQEIIDTCDHLMPPG